MLRLDDYVKEHDLRVGLIKLDVEGSEFEIIRGAVETIKRDRPILAVAFYHLPEEFYELKPYLESLDLGYGFRVRRSCFCNPTCELVLIAEPSL